MPGTRTFFIKPVRGLFVQNQTPQFVEAAYYEAEDGGYINFRDTDGQKVFTIQGSMVFSIERVSETSPIAELRELMEQADATDGAVIGTVTDRKDNAEDGVTETTYRVTVEAVQAETVDLSAPQVHIHINGSVLTEEKIAVALEGAMLRYSRRFGR